GTALEEDYVGLPCLKSNLRPVRYATPFSIKGPSQQSFEKRSSLAHPYSLQEFAVYPVQLPGQLNELRLRFEAEDLDWTLFRKRVDNLNQKFWANQSTHFEKSENDVKNSVEKNKLPGTGDGDEASKHSLDCFYRQWLASEKSKFMSYNLEWWGAQLALMRGGWKSQVRIYKWKVAC
ncbi:expressed protein, partial [Phakopsora pachyrhizi]